LVIDGLNLLRAAVNGVVGMVGVVESVKAAADVHMPASVEILEQNEALRADPSLANSAPEGAGWFYRVKLSTPAELDGLMDASAYQALTG
jgi:glycine cleavage system H protein